MKTKESVPSSAKTQAPSTTKWPLVATIIGVVGMLAGVGCAAFALTIPERLPEGVVMPQLPSAPAEEAAAYSSLTGLALGSTAEKTAPVFCIQTPNGMDGARPQAGLTEAGVIFEAIAEAGITRFAAIYQNPSSAVIGPIRSLRIYYLSWDTPFDCAVVHAGGATDAIEALKRGGYRDLTENYAYMYRGTYGQRLWNNLFTTATELRQYAADTGYARSEAKGFTRMKPAEAWVKRVDESVAERLVITEPAAGDTSQMVPSVSEVSVRFGGMPNFNVVYQYDAKSNTYRRGFASGAEHEVYACPAEDLGEKNPEDVCDLEVLSPTVVVAMVVEERRADDGVHEAITTVGQGEAYIFQNGSAVHGTWKKSSWEEQIRFFDESGAEVALVPGQTIIEAVPQYGSIEF